MQQPNRLVSPSASHPSSSNNVDHVSTVFLQPADTTDADLNVVTVQQGPMGGRSVIVEGVRSQPHSAPTSHEGLPSGSGVQTLLGFPGLRQDTRDGSMRMASGAGDMHATGQTRHQQEQQLRQLQQHQQLRNRMQQQMHTQYVSVVPQQQLQEVPLHQQLEQLTLQTVPVAGNPGAVHMNNLTWQGMAMPQHQHIPVTQVRGAPMQHASPTLVVDANGQLAFANAAYTQPSYNMSQMPLVYHTPGTNESLVLMGVGSAASSIDSHVTYISSSHPGSSNHPGSASSVQMGSLGSLVTTQPGGALMAGNPLVVLPSAGPAMSVVPAQPVASAIPPMSATQPGHVVAGLPGRFQTLSAPLQHRILALCCNNNVITIHDFDQKVISKLGVLVDTWGSQEAFMLMDQIEQRLASKQGVMKNGPGYLDVAISSHIELLKAQGKSSRMGIEEYAMQALVPVVFQELQQTINGNEWLKWSHFDEGMIQLLRRFPAQRAAEMLRELSFHNLKSVDNIKGCVSSFLNIKWREDRRKATDTPFDPMAGMGMSRGF